MTNVDFNPFSNSVGNFHVAVADNGNFLGGNANGALPEGQSTTASFLVSTALNASAFESALLTGYQNGTLHFGARFQQVNAGEGSDKLLGGGMNTPLVVPEPSTILGAIALLPVGLWALRRLRTA